MSLTRKFLKALGLEADVIDQIIEAHTESQDAIKAERDKAQQSVQQMAEVQAKLEKANSRIAELEKAGGDAAKVQADFDAYKAKVTAKETARTKETVLDQLMDDSGITNRASVRKLIRQTFDLEKIELDEKGAAKNHDALVDGIKADFADFVGKPGSDPLPPNNPPAGGGKITRADIDKMTPEEINKNWDAVKAVLATKE